jgi:hypothetical protein
MPLMVLQLRNRRRRRTKIWFFIDLVAANAARPSPSKACRRVVASFRNGEYRRFPRRHLSRRVGAAACRHLHLPRVFFQCLPLRLNRKLRQCVRRTRTFPHRSRGPGVHKIARRVSVTAGSAGASAGKVLPQKTRMAPCHIPPIRRPSASPPPGTGRSIDRCSPRQCLICRLSAIKSTKTPKYTPFLPSR